MPAPEPKRTETSVCATSLSLSLSLRLTLQAVEKEDKAASKPEGEEEGVRDCICWGTVA